jgi:HAD superfamily hydrolase (TIGR01662 family)
MEHLARAILAGLTAPRPACEDQLGAQAGGSAMIRLVVFDWGDTVMKDFRDQKGPMADWPRVEAIPGVRDALRALSPRYRLALATNAADSGEKRVREALARLDLEQFFEQILTARELGVAKPTPEFFRAVLERCACPAHEAVMVGDSFASDVAGARAVGMKAIWLNPRKLAAEGPADAVITAMADLAQAIERLA